MVMERQRTKAKTQTAIPAFERDALNSVISGVEQQMAQFINTENVNSGMTGKERQRLFGAGVKNYGFISKAWNIARENQQFLPPFFAREQFGGDVRELEQLRRLDMTLGQFKEAVGKCLLIKSDKCYREALRVYGSLQEQTRSRIPGSQVFHEALKGFFHRSKRTGKSVVSEKELERDVKRLLRGKADGEIVIKNKSPRASGGVREVIDGVHAKRAAVKKTVIGS
jgi:hypothetical protein